MASILTRTSLELIGRSGLDYSFDPLILDCPKNEYAETIKNFMFVPTFAPTLPSLTASQAGAGESGHAVAPPPILHQVRYTSPTPLDSQHPSLQVDASYSGHDRFDGQNCEGHY
jgi:hypothetical protein